MNSATKARYLIILATGLVAPFTAFEAYFVLSYGYAEPYSYMLSIPLGVISNFFNSVRHRLWRGQRLEELQNAKQLPIDGDLDAQCLDALGASLFRSKQESTVKLFSYTFPYYACSYQ